ncbi:MAG: transcriptional repressor [Spirochaetaceae bacterium]
MARFNRSDLREQILNLLEQTDSHPTAAWVHDQLREEFPKVAIGTVYRNLNILVSEGQIKNIRFDDATDHFDANTSRHYHFICEECGAIRDLEVPYDETLELKVSSQTGFEVHTHRLDFYGVCEQCRNNKADTREREYKSIH